MLQRKLLTDAPFACFMGEKGYKSNRKEIEIQASKPTPLLLKTWPLQALERWTGISQRVRTRPWRPLFQLAYSLLPFWPSKTVLVFLKVPMTLEHSSLCCQWGQRVILRGSYSRPQTRLLLSQFGSQWKIKKTYFQLKNPAKLIKISLFKHAVLYTAVFRIFCPSFLHWNIRTLGDAHQHRTAMPFVMSIS